MLTDQFANILNANSIIAKTVPGFRVSARQSGQRLPGMRGTATA